MISCPSCGFENVDGIKFCGECGQRLTDSADAAASAAASPPGDLTFDGAPTIAPAAAGARDGPAPSSSSPTSPAERYRILEKIGQGGMGSVWKAEDTQFSPPRLVAIKRLLESDAENRLAVSRFLQEAGAVAQLNHLHIVTVFDVGEDADGRYIVMEHVDGTPLDQLISGKGKLSSEETLGIARGIASALSYAHKKRVIHRDIKPANVLVARDGAAKVLDFGLARIGGGSEVSVTGYGMGTMDYAPPEQKRDAKSVDHRADIYALGATMYQMLTGESPKTIRSDRLPAGFDQVVLRCLEERPEDRYFSVDELVADLEKVASGETGASRRKVVIEEEPEGTCASCGAPNSVEARFCRKCGAGLFENCIRCRKELRAGTEHCIHCGVNLPRAREADKHLAKAEEHLGEHRYGRALKELDRMLELEPDHAEGKSLRSEAREKKDRAERLRSEGEACVERKDFAGAESAFRDLLDILPGNEEVVGLLQDSRIALGRLKLEAGSIQQAALAFERARGLGSTDPRVEAGLRECDKREIARTRFRLTAALVVAAVVGAVIGIVYLVNREAPPEGRSGNRRSVSQASERPSPSGSTATRQREREASPARRSPPAVVSKFARIGRNSQGYEEYRHDRTGIVFVKLPGGTFRMGSPSSESDRDSDEGPVHDVTLSPFLIAKHEVTQAQWRKVMGTSPSRFKGDDLPVEQVSWEECQEFCRKAGLRLPTEAQWEYACRAGTSGPYAGPGRLDDMGWYSSNSGSKTHSVGGKQPNGFGLHDMHGNVWEWCEDVYDSDFYETAAARRKDPVCTTGSGSRVNRGGCWDYIAGYCRSAYRFGYPPSFRDHSLGFRPSSPSSP